MSQVGRISGPLLFANLERNGVDLAFETDLIYLDVSAGKIGINNSSPSNDLQILDTTRTVSLITDTQADIANINIQDTTIQPFPGNLFLDARYKITASNIQTGDVFIDDNYISTTNSNSNLELRPNGTGRVEVYNNLEVNGDIHADGNITLEGNITFGDSVAQDTITFETDITSDIDPNTTIPQSIYDLGKADKRWLEANNRLTNISRINATDFALGGVDLTLSPGKTIYVAKNGDNDSSGTNIQAPFETIDYAVTQATSGDTIYVLPGEYEESCPIVVPAGVTVIGHDVRNTIISPPSSASTTDIFHLNGETTVQNFTIKDFFYNSGTDVGYAFRFAPNATVTSRSPYIQNITVSTQGTTTSASDPRGFASADAGKGALVDGASVLSTSNDASMLFHAVTFITPGVDALTMTNGVRVEWLNSFTYFANRGLYAVNGTTGHLSTDGSTVLYGAELRSIGSANVYGNKGAVADGADTLMYLIQHNFGYIGAGKFVDNDPSRAIQVNETEELNSGTIYFSSTDHLGNFRVGEQFFVDLDTGNSTLTIDESTVDALAGLNVTTNGNIAIIDGTKVQNQNIRLSGNTIESLSGGMTIDSPVSTFINLNGDTSLTGNLDITDNFSFDGTLSLAGDQPTDTVTFNTEFSQDLEPNQHDTFTLGKEDKRWNFAYVNDADLNGITIETNFITTTDSNADLELRPNGTGKVNITDDVGIGNDITVGGTSTFQNLQVATIDVDADITATDFTIRNFDIQGNLGQLGRTQFENIVIDDNFISTTVSNSDLELRAAGTGEVTTEEFVRINNTLFNESTTTTGPVTVSGQTTFTTLTTDDITINSNSIQVNNTNQDLNVSASGDVKVNNSDVLIEENLTVESNTNFADLNVIGNLQHTGNRTHTGNYNIAGEISNGNILIEDNFITATESNSDLELRANGTGEIYIPDSVTVNNNLDANGTSTFSNFTVTGTFAPGFSYVDGDRGFTGNLTVTQNIDVTQQAQFEEILIDDNFITTTSSNADLELRAVGTGEVLIPNNNVEITNDLSVANAQVVNVNIAQDLVLNELIIPPSIIEIDDNFISTRISNADLDLRADGNGNIVFTDNTTITNALNVNTLSTLDDVEITGITNINGNTTFNNDYTVTGTLTTDELVLTESKQEFEGITIDGNVIKSVNSNSDLELRANGTGKVVFQEDVVFENDVSADNLTAFNIIADQDFEAALLDSDDVEFFNNVVTTTLSNSNLELRANGTGIIDVQNDLDITNNLTVNDLTTINNVVNISDPVTVNNNVTMTGDLQTTSGATINGTFTSAHTTGPLEYDRIANFYITNNQIMLDSNASDLTLNASGTGVVSLTDTIVSQDMSANAASFGSLRILDSVALENMVSSTDIEIFDNVITTTNSNSNLELRAAGDVEIDNNFDVTSNVVVDGANSLQDTNINATLNINSNVNQSGDRDITGNVSVTNLTVDRQTDLGNFTFEDSTLTNNNAGDLTFTASGTGNVIIEQGKVDNNLSAASASASNFVIDNIVTANKFVTTDDIEIFQNVITTTNSNSNLELRTSGTGTVFIEDLEFDASTLTSNDDIIITSENVIFDNVRSISLPQGDNSQRIVATGGTFVLDGGNGVNDPHLSTVSGGNATTVFGPSDVFYDAGTSLEPNGNPGDLRFNTESNLFEGFSQANQYFGGVFSEDSRTNVQTNNNEIEFTISDTKVGSVAYDGVTINTSLQTASLIIENNTITAPVNTSLQLTPNGAGTVQFFDHTRLNDNKIQNLANDGPLTLESTDDGYIKINTLVNGFVVPVGDDTNRGLTPVVGELRYNTTAGDNGGSEVYNGTEWVSVAGDNSQADALVIGEAIDEWTLILG
jgi:hypothetical protein